jgi:phosphatidylinositol 4-kinase type 2
MPKGRPTTSGYARLAQADESEALLDGVDQNDANRGYPTISSPTESRNGQPARRADRMSQPTPPSFRKRRRNSGVDLKALNVRLERWAEEIATKFKLKKQTRAADTEQLEIQHSVFQAPDWIRPANNETLHTVYADPPGTRMAKTEFEDTVESVRVAIENGVHPLLISKGSSGSYFAKNSPGTTLGVFKPKDEEPYATRNPKWTKWIHRNLFPCFFGRVCLIPNLSYVSEAAAYVLDAQLRCGLVPYTDVVGLSSKSFHYDYWDRRAFYRRKKPLPEKLGSFQVFLKGYQDATTFFKEHPWPDQNTAALNEAPKKTRRSWAEDCRRGMVDDPNEEQALPSAEESTRRREFWTEPLQLRFREQLERLVILDYIMRNTDRGSDNWMIWIEDSGEPEESNESDEPFRRPQEHMVAGSRSTTPAETGPKVRIGAIDNSLSWPWKHPDAWRSYPFGWLFLPVSLIGQPFSETTRKHFLPLLTSKAWWAETQLALRKCFMQDVDFQEKMFAKQMAVMKGQAWNVVETLKSPDHGPLELTRRARVYVWDDLVEVPVATPLRTQSSEIRRKTHERVHFDDQNEMDISAAGNMSASVPDLPPLDEHEDTMSKSTSLLSLDSPDMDRTNPFNSSRQEEVADVREANGRTLSPPNARVLNSAKNENAESRARSSLEGGRPGLFSQTRARMSLDEQRRPRGNRHSRRLSYQHRAFNSILDEDEGDLGYAAAEDREANRRRVIVERLENVKSKNPVFTWC